MRVIKGHWVCVTSRLPSVLPFFTSKMLQTVTLTMRCLPTVPMGTAAVAWSQQGSHSIPGSIECCARVARCAQDCKWLEF